MADPQGDPRRFIVDADEDLAIGIGPEMDQRFIGMGLLQRLKAQGHSEAQIYQWIPPGKTAMVEAQLNRMSMFNGQTPESVWTAALRAIEPK